MLGFCRLPLLDALLELGPGRSLWFIFALVRLGQGPKQYDAHPQP